MRYRHLGRTGIQVSELSFGSWVTFHNQADVKAAVDMMAAVYDAGVNFFDNAEVYPKGQTQSQISDGAHRRRARGVSSARRAFDPNDEIVDSVCNGMSFPGGGDGGAVR